MLVAASTASSVVHPGIGYSMNLYAIFVDFPSYCRSVLPQQLLPASLEMDQERWAPLVYTRFGKQEKSTVESNKRVRHNTDNL